LLLLLQPLTCSLLCYGHAVEHLSTQLPLQ
jgi:hypothetical protein